ncbi:MAG: hypothetical protein R3C68_03690 [Myxococcota bacterium]
MMILPNANRRATRVRSPQIQTREGSDELAHFLDQRTTQHDQLPPYAGTLDWDGVDCLLADLDDL